MLHNNGITERHIELVYLQASSQDRPRLTISCDASRPDAKIQLWRCLNIDDYSESRFYVVPWESSCIFEVDFLSRHPIVAPMDVDKLPADWEKWGVVRDSSILVNDRPEFVHRMLTPDAFLALPRYRFEAFSDDVAFNTTAYFEFPFIYPASTNKIVYDTLTDPRRGYSFKIFLDTSADFEYDNIQKNQNLYKTWSCLKGLEYENRDLCGSAFEQLKLLEDRERWSSVPN